VPACSKLAHLGIQYGQVPRGLFEAGPGAVFDQPCGVS
jgi:hypothetical protein